MQESRRRSRWASSPGEPGSPCGPSTITTRSASCHRPGEPRPDTVCTGETRFGASSRSASLRQLGFSLEEIRECLDGRGYTLERVVDLHVAVLDEQIEQQRRLRSRLEMLAGFLRSSEPVSVEDLIKTIEVMTMTDKYYTTEQLERLNDRRRIVGDKRIQGA